MSVVITVFGSGRVREEDALYRGAMRFGQLLGAAGFGIATGGYSGVMEAVLRGAALYPVRRIGVVTAALSARPANPYVDELVTVHSYIERLQKLVEIGVAYILFPGGTGTLLELFAVWALRERNLLPDKPIICVGQGWQPLLQAVVEAFPEAGASRHLVRVVETPEQAFEELRQAMRRLGWTGEGARTSETLNPSKGLDDEGTMA